MISAFPRSLRSMIQQELSHFNLSFKLSNLLQIMHPNEVSRVQYPVPANPSPYSAHFSMNQTNTPAFESNRFLNPLYNFHIPLQLCETSPHSSCISSNSTSDEADEQQVSLVNERKQRRMISNRESARRSRIRKQKHMDELWAHLVWLRNENHQLIDKLAHVSENHDKVVQENAQLKEKVSELRQMLSDMQLSSPYSTLRFMEDVALESVPAVETCFGSFHRFFRYLNFSNPLIGDRFNPNACAWAYGMNIFDLDAWRREQFTEMYHSWQNLNVDRTLWNSGTLPPGLVTFYSLAKSLDKSWHVLGLGYNPGISVDVINNAAVIHYNANMKPWLDIAMIRYKNLWTKYVDNDMEFVQTCSFGVSVCNCCCFSFNNQVKEI